MNVSTSLHSIARMLLAPPEVDAAGYGANHLNDIEKGILYAIAFALTSGVATALYDYFCMNGLEQKRDELNEIRSVMKKQLDSRDASSLTDLQRLTVDCKLNGQNHTLVLIQRDGNIEVSLEQGSGFGVVLPNTTFSNLHQKLAGRAQAGSPVTNNHSENLKPSLTRCDSEGSIDDDLERLKSGRLLLPGRRSRPDYGSAYRSLPQESRVFNTAERLHYAHDEWPAPVDAIEAFTLEMQLEARKKFDT